MNPAILESTGPASPASTRRPATNFTYLIEKEFSVDNLKPVDRPVGEPGPGEVLLGIRAASLNFRDYDILRGQYPAGHYAPPFIPVSDVAGEILALGAGVTGFRVGDRAMPNFWQVWDSGERPPAGAETLGGPLPGLLRQRALLPASGLVRIPDYLSFEQASTLPIAAVTAWNALIVQGGLKPGETVLVQGTGGVAIFALQIAKLAGARVIVTSSSDEKLERARSLGADAGINYRRHPEWSKQVAELTNGEGVEHVIEVGGANTMAESLDSVAVGGSVYVIGYLAGVEGGLSPLRVLRKKARVRGVLVGSRQSFVEMNRAFALARLQPAIDRVFSWEETKEAFHHMGSGRHFGKIVIRVD
ncbi:NAD(P)-dependent alcohol dehydrogenase [Opitutaceae bacterium EW11]|nr:NAD(P)-dependent alcohol dehydrogenase [Opitutaceae bacterium EW11]